MQGGVEVGQTWMAGWHRKRAMPLARAHHCGRNIWRAVGDHWQPPSTSCPIEWQTNASGCPPHFGVIHIYVLVLNHLSSAVANGCMQLPAPPWRRTHLCAGRATQRPGSGHRGSTSGCRCCLSSACPSRPTGLPGRRGGHWGKGAAGWATITMNDLVFFGLIEPSSSPARSPHWLQQVVGRASSPSCVTTPPPNH